MNWSNILIGIFLSIHLVVCLLMVLVILMQRSKQEGLGAAFGGGITDSMFGAQTSQVLVKTTVWLAVFFFGATIVLARLYASRNKSDALLKKALMAAPANPIPDKAKTDAIDAINKAAAQTMDETAKAAAASAATESATTTPPAKK